MKQFKIKLTFIRPIIGSQPANEDLRRTYIVNKMTTGKTGMSGEVAMSKVEDEINNLKKDEKYNETINEIKDKSITVFYRNEEGKQSVSAIQLRGFFKDAFAFVAKELKIKDLQKKDGSDFKGEAKYRDYIGERIAFDQELYPFEGELELFSRSLRAETMMGPRICIATSELCKKPSDVTFKVLVTDDIDKRILKAILDRGLFKGISQWANAQYGTFKYTLEEITEE